MRITTNEIERLKDAIKLLPPKEVTQKVLNKKEALLKMKSEIRGLRKNGYSFEQISEFFKTQGFSVKASTMTMALKRKKRRLKSSKVNRPMDI